MLECYDVTGDDAPENARVFLYQSPGLEQVIKALQREYILHANERLKTFVMRPSADTRTIHIDKYRHREVIRTLTLTLVEY